MLSNLSDFILYIIVAAGFSLRFSPFNWYMGISRKLRNLEVAATRPNVPFGTGGLKSPNLDNNYSTYAWEFQC